jgi:phosphoglycolate phosphatase
MPVRDMLMAKQAGVLAIWAQYGTNVSESHYKKLVRISHWSDEDIEREVTLRKTAAGLKSDIVAESFSEVVEKASGNADVDGGPIASYAQC